MKGDIEKLLVAILSGSRDETDRVDQQKAKQQAQDLYKAGTVTDADTGGRGRVGAGGSST